jgi:hypothetical protein
MFSYIDPSLASLSKGARSIFAAGGGMASDEGSHPVAPTDMSISIAAKVRAR